MAAALCTNQIIVMKKMNSLIIILVPTNLAGALSESIACSLAYTSVSSVDSVSELSA